MESVGIVSSFEAATSCGSHFCFPASDFWGNEELQVFQAEERRAANILSFQLGGSVSFFLGLFFFLFFFTLFCLFLILFYEYSIERKGDHERMFYICISGASYDKVQ